MPLDEFRIVAAPEPSEEAEAAQVDEIFDGMAADIREAEDYLGDRSANAVEPGGEPAMEDDHADTRILEPIPGPGEITVTATPWLDEVDQENSSGHSLESPAAEERDLQHRERIDTPRVRHLFPVPDSDSDVEHLESSTSASAGRAEPSRAAATSRLRRRGDVASFAISSATGPTSGSCSTTGSS